MTPLEISICLHYHSSPTDDPWIDSGVPIVKPTMVSLIDCGLLTDAGVGALRASGYPQRYRPTTKLHAFVAMLCDTPFPAQEWCDPRSGKPVKGVVG